MRARDVERQCAEKNKVSTKVSVLYLIRVVAYIANCLIHGEECATAVRVLYYSSTIWSLELSAPPD